MTSHALDVCVQNAIDVRVVASNMSSIAHLVWNRFHPISAFSLKLLPLNLHPIDVSTVQIYSAAVSTRIHSAFT